VVPVRKDSSLTEKNVKKLQSTLTVKRFQKAKAKKVKAQVKQKSNSDEITTNCDSETQKAAAKLLEMEAEELKHRFNLRQRKIVSYWRKGEEEMFVYDNDVLENEEAPKKKKRKNPKSRLGGKKILIEDEDSDFSFEAKKRAKLGKRSSKGVVREKPVNFLELIMPWKKRALDEVMAANTQEYSKMIESDNIYNINLEDIAQNVEAILINPPWKKILEDPTELDKFKTLNFEKNLMKDGLIFIWVEKEFLVEIIKMFEKMGYFYVENLVWVKMNDLNKNESDIYERNTGSYDLSKLFSREDYTFFKKSKLTLLILRKKVNTKQKLELRHQRTCDVAFEYYNKATDVDKKPSYYVYSLIETLLPKAMVDESAKKKELRMLELWSNKECRKGWIKIYEKSE